MPDYQDDNSEDFHSLDFDEKIEIEKLQATIRSMSNFTDDSEGFLSQSPKALMEGGIANLEKAAAQEYDPYAEIEKPVVRKSGPRAKKFVVMVNSDNVEFFDKIPMEERTKLFNDLLSRYKNNKNVVVNKSIELTIKNYKDVQNNFEKLYESRNPSRLNAVRRTVY